MSALSAIQFIVNSSVSLCPKIHFGRVKSEIVISLEIKERSTRIVGDWPTKLCN